MKRLKQIMFLLLCLCLPLNGAAQGKNRDDSHYLAGAVPEIDGKVVFTKEFSIPDMAKKEIMDRVAQWMETRLSQNGNKESRVVYVNEELGQVVGIGREWIVFKSSALSLDRTEVTYQLTTTCKPGTCILQVEKIKYSYRNGEEKYTAEGWITDNYALNKHKTKLVLGLAKWRRKTIDFVDGLTESLSKALSAVPETKPAITAEKDSFPSGGLIVIDTPQQPKPAQAQPQDVEPQETAKLQTGGYQEVDPGQLPAGLIRMGEGQLVIVIGSDEFNRTSMTANAGGSLGQMSGKTVVFTLLSPDQPYGQLESADTYAVRFYPAGAKQPSVILDCKKMPSQAAPEGQPRMYIGEVTKARIAQNQ